VTSVFRYRNRYTRQVVERDERDVRLDRLSHRWDLVESPALDPPDEPVEVVERGLVAPSKRAPRAEWAAYARLRGATPADVADMTRAQLVDRYGGD
jgi:hypothetical protein